MTGDYARKVGRATTNVVRAVILVSAASGLEGITATLLTMCENKETDV